MGIPKLHINDIDLYYEITGHGEPVLFIHGLGSSCRDWELQTDVFAKHFQMVKFDLRGHGRSGKPPGPYSIPLFAKDTAGLIQSLDIAPVHVVGISLGGMITFQLAADHPELVKSMVIANAGPEMIIRTWKDRREAFLRFAIVRLLGMRRMGKVLSKRLFPEEGYDDVRQAFVERWAENDPRAYSESMRAIIGWSISDRLSNIQVPALILAADEDYSPLAVKEECVARIPHAELAVIKNSRHATPVERPEQFNETVLAFLMNQKGM